MKLLHGLLGFGCWSVDRMTEELNDEEQEERNRQEDQNSDDLGRWHGEYRRTTNADDRERGGSVLRMARLRLLRADGRRSHCRACTIACSKYIGEIYRSSEEG